MSAGSVISVPQPEQGRDSIEGPPRFAHTGSGTSASARRPARFAWFRKRDAGFGGESPGRLAIFGSDARLAYRRTLFGPLGIHSPRSHSTNFLAPFM
jgi:hypothetical protein